MTQRPLERERLPAALSSFIAWSVFPSLDRAGERLIGKKLTARGLHGFYCSAKTRERSRKGDRTGPKSRYTQRRCPGHPTPPNQTLQPHAMHFDPLAASAMEAESSPARGTDGYPVRRRDFVREAMPQR
jgi:hypothetical protein